MENRLRYVIGWKKKLKALVPRKAKYTLLASGIEFILRRTRWLDGDDAPPSFINYSGSGDFVPLGNQLVRLMVERTGLMEGMKVLDIGCGIGRNAVALSKRFGDNLDYLGFDIVRFGIVWCGKRFSASKNYGFVHADIYNSFYNPTGKSKASDYMFPAADKSLDFIFATSVYTHMQASEVEHYLTETARCLKLDGRAYFTCFILDVESKAQIASNKTLFSFRHPLTGAYTESASEPDLAVAFESAVFERMVAQAGLMVSAFYPGSWRGIGYNDFQDTYVLQLG